MIDQNTSTEIFDAIAKRRGERRNFMKVAGGATAAFGGATLLSACGADNNNPNATPTATTSPSPTSTASAATLDLDILNFALNLEYLEAQFYVYAVTGQGLATSQTTGPNSAAPGTVTGGAQANLSGDPLVLAYAREIAADETAHVTFLRAAIGSSAVAMPNINIGGGTNGAFTQAAIAAGIITQGQTFDPYASPENFLLGAFIFEDVGVSAYKGAAPLITNKTYLEAAAGILAAEAYHAGLVRTVLYSKGIGTPSAPAIPALIINAQKISDARDSLDGTVASNSVGAVDIDQGLTVTNAGVTDANLVPTDGNGIAYSRSVSQVLNIVYLNTAAKTAGASMGGFFPNGLNATLPAFKTSAANP
ncbi:ferritin-like domain-containing protein [Sphingomonas aliaeris]|uniref:Ferritin-like domain-containing protein n=1 Tax=Sphingomonas aliaeris TaxID=2759526 RepID=A0A974NUP2_9SPHN|nr:ferritin-like domain-containing protein [Sphingomonas aliaeris]QQV77256.1 ferritin-like domain-containing protein [Sphingomonas aliaeris]